MAAITSTAAGNWSATGTWTGGVVPVEGDTVVITHRVTIDQDITVGADTATAAIDVQSSGILEYLSTAAAVYTLTCKGDLKTTGTGKFEFGTVANPIGSSLGLTVKLNYSASLSDGEYGMILSGTGTHTFQGASKTYDRTLLAANNGGSCTTSGTTVTRLEGTGFTGKSGTMTINGTDYTISSVTNDNTIVLTGSAGTQPTGVPFIFQSDNGTLTTADSTGWADNDLIGIAPTGRTVAAYEKFSLNGAASGTTLTLDGGAGSDGGLKWGHMGTSPVQAEIVNLTRNIQITAYNSTAVGYVNVATTSVVDFDWVEFSYLGENATNKRGIEINTTTGSCSINRCAVHDTEDGAIYVTGSTFNNVTITNNVLFSVSTVTALHAVNLVSITTGTSITVTGNIVIGTNTSCNGYQLNDLGITCSDNVAVSCNQGHVFNETVTTAPPTFSNLTAHTCGANGIQLSGASYIVENPVTWRCGFGGIEISACRNVFVTGGVSFGNALQGYRVAGSCIATLKTCSGNGDTAFTQGYGFGSQTSGMVTQCILEDCDFGTASGIKTTNLTADIGIAGSGSVHQWILRNPILASPTEVLINNANDFSDAGTYVKIQRKDQTDGLHITHYPHGTVEIEQTTFKTAAPALKATPSNASIKLEAISWFPKVNDAGTLTPTVWVRKNSSYNGAAPRLMVRRHVAAGITADTVLDTFTAAADTWEQLTGTTAAVGDDAVLEIFVDCDGTAGSIFVDDFA